MTTDPKNERALGTDDYLALHRACRTRHAVARVDPGCVIVYAESLVCDQCGRRTLPAHEAAGRTFCRRCCPACAAAR